MNYTAIAHLPNMEALGQYLREVREGQSISKESVAEQLRIRPLYLNALESGDWSALPGMAYGRGYLRRYAELLRLPQDEVMEVCEKLQGKVSSRLHYFETASTERNPSRGILWMSLFAALMVALAWYVGQEDAPELPAPDYALPKAMMEEQHQAAEITPSPYSLPAQECMKLVQVAQDPCYLVQEPKAPAMLAYQPITRHYQP